MEEGVEVIKAFRVEGDRAAGREGCTEVAMGGVYKERFDIVWCEV